MSSVRYMQAPFALSLAIQPFNYFSPEANGLELECYIAMTLHLANFEAQPVLNFWSWPVVYLQPVSMEIDA